MATDLGEVVARTLLVRNSSGTLVDADANPTWAVTLPDGTAGTPPAVGHPSTGAYTVDYLTVQAGLHADIWTATVAGLVRKEGPDAFLVRAATPGPLLGLAEAKQQLRITSVDTARDEELREYIEAATVLCEDHVGRSFRRQQVTETHDGGGCVLALRRTPVQSVTTVTESGTTLTASDWVLDANAGLLYRGTTAAAIAWRYGVQNIIASYIAGASAPTSTVRQAVRVTLAHLWSTQRGPSNLPRQSGSVDEYAPGTAWSLPRRAEELLDGQIGPGFA